MIRYFGQRVPSAFYPNGTAVRFGDHVFYTSERKTVLAQVVGAADNRVQIQQRGNPARNIMVPATSLKLDAQAVAR